MQCKSVNIAHVCKKDSEKGLWCDQELLQEAFLLKQNLNYKQGGPLFNTWNLYHISPLYPWKSDSFRSVG